MDRPSEEESPRWEGTFDRRIDPSTPSRQQGFVVTVQEWNRLRERVMNIRSRESLWLSGVSAFASAGVAFGVGVVSIQQAENIAFWLLVFFYVATFVGLFCAVLCVLGYFESRGRRQDDIKIVIEYMDDVEAIYRDRSSDQ